MSEEYLAHSGVKKQKWYRRRYQNYDGSLTPEGRIHYGVGPPRGSKEAEDKKSKSSDHVSFNGTAKKQLQEIKDSFKKLKESRKTIQEEREKRFVENAKKRITDAENAKKEREAHEAEVLARKKQEREEKEKERILKKEEERIAIEEAEAARQRLETEALKQYYREHPLQIYSAKDKLSPEDIAEVKKNIKLDSELKDFRREQIMRYVRTADDVANAIGTAYKGADNLKKLYNVGAETYNAFVAAKDPNDGKKPLRRIGDGKNEKDTSNKPKYIEKIGDRYFYDRADLAAYKANKSTADRIVTAYSKSDDKQRKKFEKDLKDIYNKKVRTGDLSGADKQKFAAAWSAIDYVLKNEEGLDEYLKRNGSIAHSDFSFDDLIGSDNLEHHQRKGAKWGVMNGPPYPLDRKTVKSAYGSSAKVAKDAPDSWDKPKSEPKSITSHFRERAEKKKLANKISKGLGTEDVKDALNNGKIKNAKELKDAYRKYSDAVKESNYYTSAIDAFYNSKYYEKTVEDAYRDTIKAFEKNDPEYLKEIIKRNNGSKENLDAYHDFRKLYEGFEDEYSQKALKEYENTSEYKDYKAHEVKVDRANAALMEETNKAINQLVGTYGDKKIELDGRLSGSVSDSVYGELMKSLGSSYIEENKKSKESESNTEKDPKYLEKVKTSGGDERYIYDKDELAAYKDRSSDDKLKYVKEELIPNEIKNIEKQLKEAKSEKHPDPDYIELLEDELSDIRNFTEEDFHAIMEMQSEKSLNTKQDNHNRDNLYADLEKDGFKKETYEMDGKKYSYGYTKSIKDPDKNISELSIEVDDEEGFRKPGLSNGEIEDIVSNIQNNFKDINKNIKSQMADYACEEERGGPWSWEGLNLSKKEIRDRFMDNLGGQQSNGKISPGYVSYRVMQDGLGEVIYDDGGAYYGHFLISDIDWKTMKVGRYSVNG